MSEATPTRSSAQLSAWRLTDYLDLGIIGATHGLSDGFAGMLKPILALIVIDLGLSTLDAGALLSVFSVSTFLFLYPVSLFADESGHKVRILVTGMSVAALAFVGMRWSASFATVALCAFLAGAGNATFHPCGTALVAERFPQRRAVAVSIFSMMGNGGASIIPVVLAAIAVNLNWRAAVAICASPALLLLPALWVRYGQGLAPQTKAPVSEQSQSSSGRSCAQPPSERFDSRPPGGLPFSEQTSVWQRLRVISRQAVQNRSVVLLATVYALSGMGTGLISGFLSLLAVERFGISIATVGLMLSGYFLAGVFAKPLMGLLYNAWGVRPALVAPLLVAGLLVAVLALAPWRIILFPLIVLIGVAVPISPIILTAAAEMSNRQSLASSVGLIYTSHGLNFISPLIGGWLAQQFDLGASYLFAALLLWIAAVVALQLPRTGAPDGDYGESTG